MLLAFAAAGLPTVASRHAGIDAARGNPGTLVAISVTSAPLDLGRLDPSAFGDWDEKAR